MKDLTAKQSGLRWLWLALLVFVLDIGSKLLVMNTMGYGWPNRIEILPFFNLLYVHNYGAAFSFLSDAGGWQRWFFAIIALSVSGLLMYWMRSTPASNRILNIAYALVIGGAIGNLFDRLVHGFVVDFLDFYLGSNHWPAFNLADTAIVVGAGLIVLESVIASKKPQAEAE
ncbi:lipoprotein signal peptidase [Grimontia hollisae]|uniref:Lipoprotein signal peptidase n=2 Tax=Grimontia hollisae TaxID=673 RepID=D0I808_GRIHO|nr:signal peptidase II [Grimontia hollisae]AMG31092.1 lipoprotein signal peptidase [Grimontia hollisae]EEY72777.1 lipoprotein signal peptidase [Grimontia hollisae CIP 101886]MDF2185210.1 signal peptidase II [Grimontia hollisae]STO46715.1 Lipoprotein signal peptidase [Grimontia hollisae]STO58352.1 Lipoprotein signal peptidase [Grimontia hollisae]